MDFPISFVARTEPGRGRGKEMHVPTINLLLEDVHPALDDGIYACLVKIDGKKENAAMHLGPRPVFHDTKTCEVHLIDREVEKAPDMLTVEVVAYLRPVLDFPSEKALLEQIQKDIADSRAILKGHA